MTPDEERTLLATMTKVGTKMDMLISDDTSKGIVPEMKSDHAILARTVGKQGEQISYWKGAIAFVGIMLLAFGAALLTHILGGK